MEDVVLMRYNFLKETSDVSDLVENDIVPSLTRVSIKYNQQNN